MVAVIHAGGSLREAINYNERKVQKKDAVFLEAGYYLKDPADLTFKQKLARFENLIALNDKVKVTHLHVTLNFAPGEDLAAEQLKEIAALYLERIGFAHQPYLLYQHHDSGHPHLHLVTTTIKPDGSSINLHNIGRNQSAKARREIEKEFGLIKADGRGNRDFELKPVSTQKVEYGETETKRAISNVLQSVLKSYKYTSLPELNAALKQYNVMADRGSEDSRIFKNNGLVYHALDASANRVGVPIKASDFHFKPTLKYLNQQFAINESERAKHKTRIKNTIDLMLLGRHGHSVQSLAAELEKEGIRMVLRKSDSGLLYGVTYVDNRTKCVFNGSALGKSYSAKGILERCSGPDVSHKKLSQQPEVKPALKTAGKSQKSELLYELLTKDNFKGKAGSDKLIDDLFAPLSENDPVPWQLRKARRKKRRKSIR